MKITKAILASCASHLLLNPCVAAAFAPPIKRSERIRGLEGAPILTSHSLSATTTSPRYALKRPDQELDNDDGNSLSDTTRRGVLSALGAGGTLLSGPGQENLAQAASSDGPLADLPMRRLSLPKGGLGRDYVLVQLKINGQGPFDFMVDSGLTTEMITPHLQQTLGIGVNKKTPTIQGLAAGGSTSGGALVPLSGASLCCGSFADKSKTDLPLPTLTAVVTDFPQQHLDPAHDPVEGMLGMELLDMFDVDFDFSKGRLRFWAPGTAAAAAARAGLVKIPDVVVNESGLLGIRVTAPGMTQPVVGLLDCGSSTSFANWQAAGLLGLSTDPNSYRNEPAMMGIGIDGRPQQMPTKQVQFTFCGDAVKGKDGLGFEQPPSNWKPWSPVRIALGELPVFSQLLGDGITPYKGPAVLLGLDVLAQRRFILETGKGRARRLFVSPS